MRIHEHWPARIVAPLTPSHDEIPPADDLAAITQQQITQRLGNEKVVYFPPRQPHLNSVSATTTTTVLQPLYRSTCVSRHLQL